MTRSQVERKLTTILGSFTSMRASYIGGRQYVEAFDVRTGRTYATADADTARRAYQAIILAAQDYAFSLAQEALAA